MIAFASAAPMLAPPPTICPMIDFPKANVIADTMEPKTIASPSKCDVDCRRSFHGLVLFSIVFPFSSIEADAEAAAASPGANWFVVEMAKK